MKESAYDSTGTARTRSLLRSLSIRTRYFLPLDDALVFSAKSISGATAQERINAQYYFLQDVVAQEVPKPGTRIPE
jgi:hypothetical protein